MPIRVECEECGKRYQLPEKAAGDIIPCRDCGADIEVPGRRRRRGHGSYRDDYEDEVAWYQNPPVLIGGGVGAVALIVVLVLVMTGGNSEPAPGDVASNETTGESSPASSQPGFRSNVTGNSSTTVVTNPSRPRPRPGATSGSTTQPQSSQPGAIRSGANSGFGGSATTNPGTATSPVTSPAPEEWFVKADPPATPIEYSTKSVAIPVQRGSEIWYPSTPEPILAIGNLPETFQVISLNSLSVLHQVQLDLRGVPSFAISPDGAQLAAVVGRRGEAVIRVISLKNGQDLTSIDPPDECNVGHGMFIDFLPDNRLLVQTQPERKAGEALRPGEHEFWMFPINDDDETAIRFRAQLARSNMLKLSPGRNFLACASPAGKVDFYEMAGGGRIAEVSLVNSNVRQRGSLVAGAMGFSSDGSEFAVAVRQGIRPEIISWDMQTGQVRTRVEAPLQLAHIRNSELQFIGETGWVIGHGEYGVSRQGALLFEQPRSITNFPVRVFAAAEGAAKHRVLAYRGDSREGQLTTFDVNATTSGGTSEPSTTVATANQFPVTEAVRAGSRSIDVDAGSVDWQPSVDPGQSRSAMQLSDPVPLSRDIVHDYLLSGNRVVLLEGENRSRSRNRSAWRGLSGENAAGSRLAAIRIPSGETEARIDIPPESTLIHVSNSGNLALTRRDDLAILDVWSLADGKHVCGFQYAAEDLAPAFTQFVGEDKVVVASAPDRETRIVSLWEIDGCRQLYSMTLTRRTIQASGPDGKVELKFFPTPIAISPGGSHIAIDLGDRIRLFDLATGDVRGDLTMQRERRISYYSKGYVSAFHPTGQKLAVALPGDGQTDFVIWDLESGKLIFDEPLSFSQYGARSLAWQGDSHLLMSDRNRSSWRLIDLERHCVVWDFRSGSRIDEIDSSGRFIGTSQISGQGSRRTVLESDQVPFADTIAKVKEIMPQPLPPILQSGDRVRIEVGTMSKMPAGFVAEVKDKLTTVFAAVGITVSESASVTYRAFMTLEKSVNKNETYESRAIFSDRPPQRFSVNVTEEEYALRMEIVDSTGKVRWGRDGHASSHAPYSVYTKDEVPSAAIRKETESSIVWSTRRFFLNPALPRKIYEQPTFGKNEALQYPGFDTTLIGAQRSDLDSTNATIAAAAQADERSFLKNSREYFNDLYGDLLKNEDSWPDRVRWSPGLKRATIALKWGFAVQFSRNPPEGSFIRIQQVNEETIPLFDKPTAGAGPKVIAELRQIEAEGGFGKFPEFRDNRVREPALLGTGSQREILEAAHKAKLDFVVIAYFYRRGQSVEMSLRVLDSTNGTKLFETDRLTQAKLARSAADLGASVASEVAEFVKQNISLKPVPDLSAELVRDRILFLTENDSINPLCELFELRFYRKNGGTTEAKAVAAALKLLRGARDARPIVAGTQEECSAAVTNLVDQLKSNARK